jgi:SHAQKYF class myb-like DNA-binding protein
MEEHKLFLQALQLHGKNWKKVQKFIGTRSCSQARSHAQKYFGKYFELITRGNVYNTNASNSTYFKQSTTAKDLCNRTTDDQGRTVQFIPSGKEFYAQGAIEQI